MKRHFSTLGLLGALLLAAAPEAGLAQDSSALKIGPQGEVSVPAFDMPQSNLASPEMGASIKKRITGPRANEDVLAEWVEADKAKYPVTIEPSHIAGVPVVIYTPKAGIAARNKGLTLIDVHGGGFSGCFDECSALESIPLAAISGIKVITIDYREGPDNHYPAASEDTATVYAALLKSQKAKTIAIYGCSAGGQLVTEALAWFQVHNLPRPAAAGIFCAGGTPSTMGDSAFIGTLIGNGETPRPRPADDAAPRTGYFAGADLKDPLVSPVLSPETLAKYPPTLIISGTRDMLLSDALFLHEKLMAVGSPSDLQVWEGARHAFFYDPSVPEAADAFHLMAKFFHQKLGR